MTMKAWVSGDTPGVEHLRITDIARPVAVANQMLVRVTHSALNYSDLLMVADQYQVRPPRPFTLGQEIAGIVETAPDGCRFAQGDQIVSKVLWGGFAEFVLIRPDMAIRVPRGFGPAQAAALPVSYTTALVALDYCANLKPSEVVLIHAAAGGVGLAAVEIAAARGATIIATASAPDRLAIAKVHGAHHGVNYRDADWVDQVKALTNGAGANVILDPVGGEIGENSLRCIAMDGKLLIVGFSSGKMPRLMPHRLLLKRASAVGVYWNHDTDHELMVRIQASLEQSIAENRINPLVDDKYRIAELPQALADLANRRVVGKMVLRVGPEAENWHE